MRSRQALNLNLSSAITCFRRIFVFLRERKGGKKYIVLSKSNWFLHCVVRNFSSADSYQPCHRPLVPLVACCFNHTLESDGICQQPSPPPPEQHLSKNMTHRVHVGVNLSAGRAAWSSRPRRGTWPRNWWSGSPLQVGHALVCPMVVNTCCIPKLIP